MYYEDDDKWYYVRTKLQATKNHQKGSQDLRKGGVIPFEENEMGVDSGLYLELYMKLLNPGNPCMFQQPRYGKAFKKTIHKKQHLQPGHIVCYVWEKNSLIRKMNLTFKLTKAP